MKSTGIDKLDQFVGGGIPVGKSMLFFTSPGVENDVFGYQILASRIKKEKAFCFLNTTIPDVAKKTIFNYGWNFDAAEQKGNFFFIDACSAGIGLPGHCKYVIEEATPEETSKIITKSINETKGGTGVINSLSSIIDLVGEKETIKLVKKWNQLALKNKSNLVYLLTVWDYPKDFLEEIQKAMNSVVMVSGIEERILIGQYFAVIKADWIKHVGTSVLFQVARPGGVKVFIPKILITGPFNAGKSSFMHSLATKAVSVDRTALEKIPTTVALDVGHVDYKTFQADIFGTPGQQRFDLLLAPLGREAVGIFIVVDSTKPETFTRALEMVKKCNVEGLPRVIIANKQNLPKALKPEEIHKKMGLDKKIPVMGVSLDMEKYKKGQEPAPLNKEEVYKALDALLDQIYK